MSEITFRSLHSKVATIVPLNHLDEIREDAYMMALSHVAESKDYVNWFAGRGKGRYLILDNSAVELGDPEPFETYLNKAIAMQADEIMLPDIFRKPEETLQEAERCMKIISKANRRVNIMVIPQADTILGWFKNAKDLLKIRTLNNDFRSGFWEATTVGVSARYTEMFNGNRLNMVWLLATMLPNFQKVHFLGHYTDPRVEAYPALKYSFIQGVDSSYPCVYAQHGVELTPSLMGQPRPSRNIDFLNDQYEVELLRKNMKVWRDACLNPSE